MRNLLLRQRWYTDHTVLWEELWVKVCDQNQSPRRGGYLINGKIKDDKVPMSGNPGICHTRRPQVRASEGRALLVTPEAIISTFAVARRRPTREPFFVTWSPYLLVKFLNLIPHCQNVAFGQNFF